MNSLPIIIAAAAAAAVVVLVLVVVLVSRRRRAAAADDESAGSFLDSRPQDTFAGLGEPETRPETADDEFRLDWGRGGEEQAGAAAQTPQPAAPDASTVAAADEPAGPDEGGSASPGESAPVAATADGAAVEATEETTDATESAAVVEADDVKRAQAAVHAAGAEAEAVTQAPSAADDAGSADEAGAETEDLTEAPVAGRETVAEVELATEAPEAASGESPPEPPAPHMVPLSDIIVTTSRKMVDLNDAEVRRMLTELVRYEIDQASEFSAAGQTVDAILQLTEAEKVSRTLGMDETAARIKTMMHELRD